MGAGVYPVVWCLGTSSLAICKGTTLAYRNGTALWYTPTFTSGDAVALDFRKRVELAREAADADDMDEFMSGPLPEAASEAVGDDDPIVCCPKCNHEFPESEGLYESEGSEPPPVADVAAEPDDMDADDFSGFSVGGR